jgi:3-methylfumaryl-CoA hydratase
MEQHASDLIAAGPANRLAAALDLAGPLLADGDVLPIGWQWLYFLNAIPAAGLSTDGRGAAGDLVPAFDGLNRMWAGGSFAVARPLRIGARAKRRLSLLKTEEKQGRKGRLVLVSLEHTLCDADGVAIVERQDLVFRERKPEAAVPGERSQATPDWHRILTPDEVLLFRFSALTYNAHRIHYDLPYATGTEGYAGLLVHGPLTALLLLDAVRRAAPERALASFAYRAVRPLYCRRLMRLCAVTPAGGGRLDVWAEDHEGYVAMRGEAVFA